VVGVDGEELMFLLMEGTVESVEVVNGNTLKPALLIGSLLRLGDMKWCCAAVLLNHEVKIDSQA
jgi:hypothetical protein